MSETRPGGSGGGAGNEAGGEEIEFPPGSLGALLQGMW